MCCSRIRRWATAMGCSSPMVCTSAVMYFLMCGMVLLIAVPVLLRVKRSTDHEREIAVGAHAVALVVDVPASVALQVLLAPLNRAARLRTRREAARASGFDARDRQLEGQRRNHQYRAGGLAHYRFCDRAEQPARHAVTTVRSDHDHVRLELVRQAGDGENGCVDQHVSDHAQSASLE